MSVRERQRRRRRRSSDPARLVLVFVGALFGLIIVAIGVGVAYVAHVASQVPPLSQLHPVINGASSVVYAADGSRLGLVGSDTLRSPIAGAEIPPLMKEATVAIEDQRFYKHGGVDLEAIIRAGLTDLTSGHTLQGGSTITMQLVRNLYIPKSAHNLNYKIKEAVLAERLEKAHKKDWILNDYLNTVPYGTVGGQTALGVQAAARVFFNEPAASLTLPQAALLAGLPQAPSVYNPFDNPVGAKARRNEVLTKMAQLGYITRAQAQGASAEPLGVVNGSRYYTQHRENFFFDYVKQQLIDRYGAATVEQGGLRIYTTIVPRLQQAARNAITGVLTAPGDPASAIVSIDPRNGYIRAMAESPQYSNSDFNLAAQSHRQAGSTFKTFVLLTALRQGVDPNSTYYKSAPFNIVDPRWGPVNIRSFSGTEGASYNITTALMQSNDPIFQKLDLDVGPQNVKQTAVDAGVTSPLDGLPAEGLGGLRVGVSPLEMANSYATIADGGWRNTPIAITRVAFPDGRVDNLGTPKRVKVFSDGVTSEATQLLEKYITDGLGTGANYGCSNSGGKTGTTDNNTDAWFVGFTAHLSTAVWIGYPKAKIPMNDVQGITVQGPTFPATIWHDYMQVATAGDCPAFPAPTQPIVYQPFSGQYQSGQGSSGNGSQSGFAPTPTQRPRRKHGHGGVQAPPVPVPVPTPGVPPGAVGSNPNAYVPPASGTASPGHGHGHGGGAPGQGGAVAP
jgi:penicillin-binding protein 1A